jgi:hypothetical protein
MKSMHERTRGLQLCHLLPILVASLWPAVCPAQAKDESPPVLPPPGEVQEALPGLALDIGTRRVESIVLVGKPQRIRLGSKLCSITADRGISIDESATALEVDPEKVVPGWTEVSYVAADRTCGENESRLRIALAGDLPVSAPESNLTIWADSGIADLKTTQPGTRLMVAVVDGLVENISACPERMCSHELGAGFLRALAEGPDKMGMVLWPEGIRLEPGSRFPVVMGKDGEELSWKDLALNVRTIVFSNVLIGSGKLDTAEDRHVIQPRFLRAIDRVTCDNAECRLTRKGILVFDIEPTAPSIRLGYTLKTGFALKAGRKLAGNDMVTLKLERCAIKAPADIPLLAGTGNHVYFVKIPRECTRADTIDLELSTKPPSRSYVRSEFDSEDPSMRILELVIDRVPLTTDRINLTVFERVGGLRRLGEVKLPVAMNYRPAQIRFEVPDIGLVDFIPSNRPARLSFGFGDPVWIGKFSVEARPGFYGISHQECGWTVLGEEGVTGNIPLRFAYRPRELSSFLGLPDGPDTLAPVIASFDTEGVYPVRNINVPLGLMTSKPDEDLLKVICGVRGEEQSINPGKLVRIPFEKRDSCRIVFFRNRIPVYAGIQRLQIKAGDFNQIISLSPGSGTLHLTVPVGERDEYEKVTVSVAHDMLSGHYTLQSQQNLGEEARFRIMLSDSWWRVSATTALPTGMFRFGSGDSEGSVPLSAGALSRINYIQNDGRDFPLGLEMGLFATNLSGQPDFSIVLGAGLSIPVLNPNTSLQASFNIHAWLEYAPTRLARDEGTVAFLFGPSFTVGRLSTTF